MTEKNGDKHDRQKAAEFDEIARTVFAPIYPVLAENILRQAAVNEGICLDLGSGPGHLALALSAASRFVTISYDINAYAQDFARENIQSAGMGDSVHLVRGDVHRLPFADSSLDLVVSRGSIFFWDFPREVFSEVQRVLKPGGSAYIGGGFGTLDLKKRIMEQMSARGGDFKGSVGQRMSPENLERLTRALESSAAGKRWVYRDDANIWFIIEKERS